MVDRVALATYKSRYEAEIVRQFLEADGISAFVTSDDCGTQDPSLEFVHSAILWVAQEEEEQARAIIANKQEESPEE